MSGRGDRIQEEECWEFTHIVENQLSSLGPNCRNGQGLLTQDMGVKSQMHSQRQE